MKRNFLKTLTIATGMLAMSFGVLNSVQGNTDTKVDLATESIESVGCYNVYIIDCGFQLGQQLICNFTGTYGPPYQCTSYNCYGTVSTRRCVLKV